MGLAQLTIPSPITGMILFSGTQVNGVGLACYGVNVCSPTASHSDKCHVDSIYLSGLKKGNGTIELKRAKPDVGSRSIGFCNASGVQTEAINPNPFNPHTTIELALALSGRSS
jgi:hypothetical protein